MTPKRPKTIILPPYRALPKRWHAEHGWYWQVVYQGRGGETVLTRYGTYDDMLDAVTDLRIRERAAENAQQPRGAELRTLNDLLETWLGEHVSARLVKKKIAQSTLSTYKQSAKRVDDDSGEVVLEAVDAEWLDKYETRRLADDYSPATVRLERVVISAAWDWAHGRRMTPNWKLPPCTLDPEPETESYVPSRSEVAATFACMVRDWRLPALRLQAATGARISEIVSLRVGDVDLGSGIVHIVESKTVSRDVPVEPDVCDMVAEWLCESGRDKLGRGGRLWLDELPTKPATPCNTAIRAAIKRCGVPHWSTHGLRYRAVIDLFESGADAKTVSEISGHSVITCLRIYRRVSTLGKRQAIQAARLGVLPAAPVGLTPVPPRPRRPRAAAARGYTGRTPDENGR